MENETLLREFEFDDTQNGLFSDLAKKMNVVGILLIVAGAVNAVSGMLSMASNAAEGISGLIFAALTLYVGIWTRKASAHFTQIVDTEGQDVHNLMVALGELRKLYALQYWTIMAVLVIMVLAFIVGLTVR